jgi:hypothetical protein
MMSTYLNQLVQVFNGAVWDGDLISKCARDRLVSDGLVCRVQGYNIITSDGVRAALASGCDSHVSKIGDDSVLLFATIAHRRYGECFSGDKDGVFTSAQFSSVVSDLLGIESLDGLVVRLILQGRLGIAACTGGPPFWRIYPFDKPSGK